MDQFFAPLTNIAVRDAGHAINAAANLIGSGGTQVHGGGNPIGNSLVQSAAMSPDHVGTIVNLAGSNVNRTPARTVSTTTTPQAPGYDANNTGTTYGTGTVSGSTTSSTAAPVDLSQYDSAINQYNNSLGRLGTQLDIARGNVTQQYGTNLNQLDSSKAAAQGQYNTQTTQNAQSLRTNKNTIADQASAGLRGLQRMLGAYGAGGSSDALYVAPQAVADQASQQRAGAGQTFAQNEQGLDTNWNNFLNQDKNSRQQLNDWQSNQLNNVQQQSDTTKQDLLSKLADLAGQRAAAAGGQYATGAQPFLDQATGLNSTIDNLGRNVATYNGTTPVYQAPSLDSYSTGTGTAAQIDPAAAGSNNPYLALLLGQQRDKTNASL